MPPWVAGTLALAVIFVVVEIAVRTDVVSATVVARPSAAMASLLAPEGRSELLSGFLLTFGMTVIAMVVEVLAGLPIGAFLYLRRDFAMAWSSWLGGLAAAPIFLLYPLFMVIFGRGATTLIVMGVLPGIIPLIIHVEHGFLGVPPIFLKVGQSVGVTRWQVFARIMIPAASATVFAGFRLALIYTLVNIIAIEYLTDTGGLGRIVADRYARFDISGTYGAIIAVTAVSVLCNWGIGRLERRVRQA